MKFNYGYQAAQAEASLQGEKLDYHSAVLPFRKHAKTCEENEGVWIDGECVDRNLNPTF